MSADRAALEAAERAALDAELAYHQAQADHHDRLLELLRPYLEGTDRTIGDALPLMTCAERAELVFLLHVLDDGLGVGR